MTDLTEDKVFFGSYIQISDDMGIVVCDAYTLPPIVLLEPIQPPHFVFDDVLQIDAGTDGWLEVYVYVREGT